MELQFTDHGIEGVVPLELLPPDVRSKYQAKPNERSKRAKKEETKGAMRQAEENQVEIKEFHFSPTYRGTGPSEVMYVDEKLMVKEMIESLGPLIVSWI